jgi:hypothetical protein
MRLVKHETDFCQFLYGIDLALAKPFIANDSRTYEYFKTHNTVLTDFIIKILKSNQKASLPRCADVGAPGTSKNFCY